jgi:hypothetical protein
MPSGFTAGTPDALAINVGVLKVNGTVIGLSDGGLDFDPGIVDLQIGFDGARAPIAGMEYRVDYKSKISGTFITPSVAFLQQCEPGGNLSGDTITPIACGTLYAAGDYLDNVELIISRGDGTNLTVTFATAKVTKWTLDSKDKQVLKVKCEIMAYLSADVAAASTDTCPYTLTVA